MMCQFEDVEIISSYPLRRAIEDELIVKLCDIRWGIEIKSLVATSHLLAEIDRDKVMKVWDEYMIWRQTIMPKLKEEDQMFVTKVDGKKVWLIEDGAAFTAMFPEDY
jgi:hypothetical protein